MATVLPTRLDIILLNIQQQLIDFIGLQNSQVVVMDPDILKPEQHPLNPLPNYIVLWPAPESINVPIFRGASRLDARATEKLEVVVRTATKLDDFKQKQIGMLDAGIGHLALRHQVWDALSGYFPQDDQENALTTEPLEPIQSMRPRLTDTKSYWMQSSLGFSFQYVLALTPPLV